MKTLHGDILNEKYVKQNKERQQEAIIIPQRVRDNVTGRSRQNLRFTTFQRLRFTILPPKRD